jgi:hypothetical protein
MTSRSVVSTHHPAGVSRSGPVDGKLENDCGPRDRDPCQQDCSAGSIDLALTAEAERVPCKHCMWLRVG